MVSEKADDKGHAGRTEDGRGKRPTRHQVAAQFCLETNSTTYRLQDPVKRYKQ